MNRYLLPLLAGLSGACGCSEPAPELLIAAPSAIQQGLQLGVFRDLRARLSVGTVNYGTFSPTSAPEQPVAGCPFDEAVDLQPDGSFHVQCTIQNAPGNLFALAAYEDAGFVDQEHPEPLLLIEKQLQIQFANGGGNHTTQTVSFDDPMASTNVLDEDDYDSNYNGVSNLGELLQGWDPQATAFSWGLKLEGVPGSVGSGSDGASYDLSVLPPAGDQLLLSHFWNDGGGAVKHIALVGTQSPGGLLWSSSSDCLPTIDGPRQRLLMLRCDGTNTSSQCYRTSVGFSGSGYASVPTHTWGDTQNWWGATAPAVEADGTTWILLYGTMGAPALKRVSADGLSVSGLLTITGIPSSACVFGPTFDNHWIGSSTLYAFYQATRENCGMTTNDGDIQLIAISLGASPAAAAPITLRGVGCNNCPPRVTVDAVGGAIYAASQNTLTAYALDGTKQWASAPVDLTRQSCGMQDFTVQNTSVPLVTSTGDILVTFGGCEVFAYASQGQPSVPQVAKWHRELKKGNPTNQGMVVRGGTLSESLGDGRMTLASACPDDPGAAAFGSNINANPSLQRLPIGGLAVDLAAVSADNPATAGFAAIAPQYENEMNGMTTLQYQPKSGVVEAAGVIYFVTDVYNTPPGAPALTCSSPPCYYVVAIGNPPLAP